MAVYRWWFGLMGCVVWCSLWWGCGDDDPMFPAAEPPLEAEPEARIPALPCEHANDCQDTTDDLCESGRWICAQHKCLLACPLDPPEQEPEPQGEPAPQPAAEPEPTPEPMAQETSCEALETQLLEEIASINTCVRDEDCAVEANPLCGDVGGCYQFHNQNVLLDELYELQDRFAREGCRRFNCVCAFPEALVCREGQCRLQE